ncbi:MAG: Vitamin B12 transport ATP-binding protein BacA [Burkholderiaceae bacterium]|nr:Vitamin B12 transport ATP-binding protein BacA [Burkholderiaceae bacterium]
MQWSHEWSNSLVWIAKASLVSALGLLIVAALLTRLTRWGHQFRQLAWPYLSPRRSWRPLATVAAILVLAIAGVRMNVLFSFWNNGFFDSMQALDAEKFWFFMRLFALLATIHVVRVLVAYLVAQAFEIHWRTWMNDRLMDDWLAGSAYYRTHFVAAAGDNPDQRIQVDITSFVGSSRALAMGAVDAAVTLVSFSVILWSLSGPLAIGSFELPRAMVFIVYLYVIVASVIAFRLGRPLIRLNFMNEKLGADFRYALIRVREYAENIAFYRGEGVERIGLAQRFASLISNLWAIVFRSMKFDGFNFAINQMAVVFPTLLQAQRFFSGAIKLGDVTQTSQAFDQVQSALSFFRLSYDTFAQYRAVLDRLTGFVAANDAARALPSITLREAPGALEIADLQVQRPDGAPLLSDLSLQLRPGDALLVQGPSGVGKTTLLRALAGLWPYATGTVARPAAHESLFLPQRPYLPLGSLRDALAYPAAHADDAHLRSALQQVQLGHLAERLDEVADWSRILSLGEQQRLAFARVLLQRPRLAFLDEATSATDEGLEHALYHLVRRELPQCMLVSVGHRSTLNAFHTHRLQLQQGGRWRLMATGDRGAPGDPALVGAD